MALVKRSEKVTDFVLPVTIKCKNGKTFRKNFYYSNDIVLYKAYYQLKKIEGNIRPSYPVIYNN